MGYEPKAKGKNGKSGKSERGGLSALLSGGGDTGGSVADWSAVDPKIIVRVILAITGKGGAIRFGYSRDGGAYSLGVYLDDESETVYFRPHEDLDMALTVLAERIESVDLS